MDGESPFGDLGHHSDLAPSVSPSSYQVIASTRSGSDPGPTKRRRMNRNAGISTGSCVTCRARKVKCSGNPGNGPCTNCVRLELVCSFTTDSNLPHSRGRVLRTPPSRSHTEAGTVRKRAQRACQECHLHKTKCSEDVPACKRCVGAGIKCEYMPARRNFSAVQHDLVAHGYTKRERSPEPQASPALQYEHDSSRPTTAGRTSDRTSSLDGSESELLTASGYLLNRHIILNHLDVWFKTFHSVQSYGFLHPETTIRDAEEERFSPTLAAGICAVTGLFTVPHFEGRKFTERCNAWVKSHLSCTAGTFDKDRLALLVLSSIYDFLVGDWPKVWEYSATASRIVTAMRYNWDSTAGTFTERESIRRLVWQVYIMDRLLAGGYNEHLTLREEDIYLSLPCSDDAFRAGQAVGSTQRLSQQSFLTNPTQAEDVAIPAIIVKLFSVRHEILKVTRSYAMAPTQLPCGRPEASTVIEDIHRLQGRIDLIKGSLPDSLLVSEANIRHHCSTPEWSSYLMLHTWIFQLHVDLYRFSLIGIREQATIDLLRELPHDFLESSRCQAVAFAITLSRFWEACIDAMAQQPQTLLWSVITVDHSLAACVVACTKVLLVARQYRIFFDLQTHSTVPPFRTEEIDDDVLVRLIESNMTILDQVRKVMPKVESMTLDLRETIDSFQTAPTAGMSAMTGPSSLRPPEDMQVHEYYYPMENLHAIQGVDEEEIHSQSASLPSSYRRSTVSSQSSQSSQISHISQIPSSSPIMQSRQIVDYAITPPGLPFFLPQTHHENITTLIAAKGGPRLAEQAGQEQQPLHAFSDYQFDVPGAVARDPGYCLVPPAPGLAVVGIPIAPGPMITAPTASQAMIPTVTAPQEQFMLASQQQLGMYTAGYQMYEVPYQEF